MNHFLCRNEWFSLSQAASDALVFVQFRRDKVIERGGERSSKRIEKSNRNTVKESAGERDEERERESRWREEKQNKRD